MYLTGRYEEASEIYARHRGSVEAVVGLARCKTAHGDYAEALRGLRLASWGDDPAINAETLRIMSQYQPYAYVRRHLRDSVGSDDPPALLWATAQWRRATARSNDAEVLYQMLVDQYKNAENVDDPDTLHYVGLAIAEQARSAGDAQQFRFLVNKLYPQALALDKNYWPAHLEAGRLFLEKYNYREAAAQFNKALAINPNAAEVHAARAALAMQSYDLLRARTSIERALAINPRLREALQLKADLLMAEFRVDEAIAVLKRDAMPLYAHHPQVRGRLAAAYGYVDGLQQSERALYGSRMQQIIFESITIDPRCGEFFDAMGDTFDLLRKYPHAARSYEEARRLRPDLTAVPGKLGMVQMRLGNESTAKQLLEDSFKVDPFNVRVKNTLEVLDVLDNYAVIETDHFVIKFDRGQDQMLAEYSAEYLENEVYPQIVDQLDYEPAEKTLLEIFNRAKNTSGHGWFSARMVGLPYIGTVGACAGRMVAIASPVDMPEPYNWSRVLKHEFVHVVNLQQTDFHIPHWFTEALAVRSEGYPRPTTWTQLLAERHAAGTLFTLDDINNGFLRPGAGEEWTLAYCQAEIYADYMVDRFGEDALAKMLSAYGDSLSTSLAIERSFGIPQEEFEAGYRKYVARLVDGLPAAKPAADSSLAMLRRAAAERPQDAPVLAQLAYAYLQRDSKSEARRYALAALEIDEKQQLAAYVMARLHLLIGDAKTAVDYLQESFQKDAPQAKHLALLSAILLRAKKYEQAERLFELGTAHFPHDDAWLKRLASLHLKAGDDEKLADILEQLVQLDTESVAFRRKLAELAMKRQDYEAAARWAMAALQIDIEDAKLHALRAAALAAMNRPGAAAKEYRYALQLEPDPLAWRLALAQACAKAGDAAEAKAELKRVLARDPDYPGARELLESLERE